ncbi:MAG TPA: EamA family transporter [Candidatus Aquilonibacter sp.]|nr:EamA family transporter [Candidatus Aquilonibacter sp.]
MQRFSLTRALPWVALVTVWILWGSTYLGIRVAVQTIPPFLMAGTRYVIAGLVLSAVMLAWKPGLLRELRAAQWRSLVTTAFLLLGIGNGFLCFAEMTVPSGVAAIVVATVPIWMVVIAALVNRTRIAAASLAGLALGMIGIVLLAGMPGAGMPLLPTVLMLVGSFAWALGSVYARKHAELRGNPLIPALEMFAGGLILCIMGLMTGESAQLHLDAITRPSIYGWLWLIGPGALIGYTAYGYAVRKLPTQIVATYGYVNPIVAVALGAVLLQEPVTLNVIAGGVSILLAVIVILSTQQRKVQREEPVVVQLDECQIAEVG